MDSVFDQENGFRATLTDFPNCSKILKFKICMLSLLFYFNFNVYIIF